jgi:putative hydrolase of the HAD superfamily
MTEPRIKLVCFDLGGVLVRICRTWQEGCVAAGLDIRSSHPLLDAPNGWYAPPDVYAAYETGRITCEEYFDLVSTAIDRRYSHDEIRSVHHAWLLGEYEGVASLIRDIHACGVKTAALSNTNHAHWARLRHMDAIRQLSHRFASHELGLAKPDPAIYQEVQKRTGVHGSSILYFDDLLPNINAALALGWNAVLIDPHARTDVQMRGALRDAAVLSRSRLQSSGASSGST